jgi:hypothetical protein
MVFLAHALLGPFDRQREPPVMLRVWGRLERGTRDRSPGPCRRRAFAGIGRSGSFVKTDYDTLRPISMRHIKFDGVSNEIERGRALLVLTTLLNPA